MWNREYKEMFANPEGYMRQQTAVQRIKPAGPDKRGHLNIKPVKPVTNPDEVDLSEILGKYGGPAKRDSNDGIVIGPGDDGNLSVSGPDPGDG